jgi:putative RecB family exonuclease
MVLAALPTSISPSRIATFTDCPRMFQYQAIERLDQPPTVWTLKGTLVHAALEGLFAAPAGARSADVAVACLHEAAASPEIVAGFSVLALDEAAVAAFVEDAEVLVRNYFQLEDPDAVDAVGVELRLETALEVGGGRDALPLRGIIDRLDRDGDGALTVVDYKTGRAPGPGRERSKLAGVETYALLCERVLGVRPVAVRLLYLRAPLIVEREVLSTTVTRQERRAVAVWQAITKAHAAGSFRPVPGPLCNYCAYADRCEGAALARVAPRLAPIAAS